MIRISDAEFEVMKVIWKRKETTSIEIIKDLHEFKWNINTVRTLIKRLLLKNAIEISAVNGKTYIYRPIIDETEYKIAATKELIKKLYNNSIREFLLEFVNNNEITKEDIEELLQKIDEREKANK